MKRPLLTRQRWMTFALIVIAVLLVSSFLLLSRFQRLISSGTTSEPVYRSHHFAMVIGDTEDPFWTSVYASAAAAAIESDSYLELTGSDLMQDYTAAQQLQMALAQKVDGILISPDGTEEISRLLLEASKQNIPVVTMMNDAPLMSRQAHVGGSSYDLGRAYAGLIRQVYEQEPELCQSVEILLDQDHTSSQEILYAAILELCQDLPLTIHATSIDHTTSFASEETVRRLILADSGPDLLVCLSDVDTISAYQAVVDYNRVGIVQVIGYYDAAHTLTAIQKGIVHSTVTVDSVQLGRQSMESLLEYITYGRTSGYSAVDLIAITQDNVDAYLQQKEGTE